MKNAERLKQRSFGVKFQSTLPRGARPAQDQANRAVSKSFNPRAHAGRDATSNTAATITAAFQSTRPRGARRRAARCRVYRGSVSIHAPTRGATARLAAKTTCCASFNPRAHAGRDTSIQTRVRRGTFQSTRPRGARPVTPQCNVSSASVSIHAPTRGATRHLPEIRAPGRVSIHAPTRGATPRTTSSKIQPIPFQSTRPRGARRMAYIGWRRGDEVSIHAPTRGATNVIQLNRTGAVVSIHAPTRGATRVGRKRVRRKIVSIHAPTRGATLQLNGWHRVGAVSIHAPTRGATPGFCTTRYAPQVSIHAPTRGATMPAEVARMQQDGFNPRAHAGRDRFGDVVADFLAAFQSTRPRGARPWRA